MEHTAIKLRAYPSKNQQHILSKWVGCTRWVYNWGLGLKKHEYEEWVKLGKPKEFKWLSTFDLQKKLKELKSEYIWLKDGESTSIQQSLKHLGDAFARFIKGEAKYPKFKNRYVKQSLHMSSTVVNEKHLALTNDDCLAVKLPKQGTWKCKLHRALPTGRLLRTVVSRNSANQWFVTLIYEVEDNYYLKQSLHQKKAKCGVDLGVVKPLTVAWQTADGTYKHKVLGVAERQKLKQLEARRKRYQRSFNRKLESLKKRKKEAVNKETGEVSYVSTKNLEKARIKVAKIYQKEVNIRRYFAEVVSKELASRFDVIKFEALNISRMTKSAKGTVNEPGKNVKQKAGLNREMLRLGLANVVALTKRKALNYGSTVKEVNPKHTSQRCSTCGYIHKGNRTTQSKFQCTSCGFRMNADKNAAVNILTRKPLEAA